MADIERPRQEKDRSAGTMQGTFRLFNIFGITVLVHWSWLIIFWLLTWTLANGYLPVVDDTLTVQQRWIAAASTAILFFLSVLAHELSHSLVARRRGVPVNNITLFVFGGVSALGGEPRTAKDEFWIAVVGPLTSFAAAIVFGAIWILTGNVGVPAVEAVAGYLALANVSVGVFNLLPGFPLDGGRILRSIVWNRSRNMLSATKVAANAGRGVAALLVAGGIYFIVSGTLVTGFWLIFIALFLWNAAESSYQQLLLNTSIGGITVESVYEPEIPRVPPTATMREFANDYVLRQNRRAFFVAPEEGDILGLVTLSDLQRAPEDQWDTLTVYRAMTPKERLIIADPSTQVLAALQLMGEHDINQIPVMDGRGPIGLVTRAGIVRAIQLRSELHSVV